MDLPESLYRRLWAKLKFEDYDLGETAQMVVDEEENRIYLRTLKDLAVGGDCFLVDHAWTFKQRAAYKNLMENEKLRERLTNICSYSEKRDLPGENPYAKKKPTLEEYWKKMEEQKEPALSYELDDYDIKSIKEWKFREEVEEIDLMNNALFDPNDITKVLMTLPNLKACWVNDNPVATNCSNFNVIGDHFDKLEIFNSSLTEKAGEWAMLFYARGSGAKTLEEITSIDLSGKNLLMVTDLSFLKKMTNLRTLDISDNVDMYKPKAMLEAEAQKAAEGSGQSFDFLDNKHDRNELLNSIPSVEHLICDIMLEAYILDTREHYKFLPNLKSINRVGLDVKDLGERTK